jgi:hypothetical protein
MSDNYKKDECPNEDTLLDLLYGGSEADGRRHVMSHIESCDDCRMGMSQFEMIADTFADIRDDISSARISPSKPTTEGNPILNWLRGIAWRPVAAASLASLVLGVVFFLGLNQNAIEVSKNKGPDIGQAISDIIGDSNGEWDDLRLADLGSEPDEGIRLFDILNEVESQ